MSSRELMELVESTIPAPLADPLPPVTLTRLAPDMNGSMPESSSWIGGLPCLGKNPWPKTNSGEYLHHLATISLAELAQFVPTGLVPVEGQLSFFVGPELVLDLESKVLHTHSGAESTLPDEMPALEDLFGRRSPSGKNRLDRSPIKLEVRSAPEPLTSDTTLKAYRLWKADFDAGRATVYWDTAYKLYDSLQYMRDETHIARGIRRAKEGQETWRKRFDGAETDRERSFATKNIENARLALDGLTTRIDEYQIFVKSVEETVSRHARWDKMAADDVAWLRDVFNQLAYDRHQDAKDNTAFGAVYEMGVGHLHSFENAAGRTYSSIIEEPAPVIQSLPAGILELIRYRPGLAPLQGSHQMFGTGTDIQHELLWYADQYLLLQIGYDRGAGLEVGDSGVIQFLIKPADLENRNWDAVKAIFTGN